MRKIRAVITIVKKSAVAGENIVDFVQTARDLGKHLKRKR